ncbi:hypothetical protein Poli38472_004213 [Pythium oligandrum]|uniref:Zinc transporter n=1 Tax=Pythium oligandrum TaxID=41045 RepID=A0A8K1FQB8_PYTOL|nr:hypothetical protein Poli38472_004213 [Pythium oligandrum]|eukprot:TMW66448.1 hypothetical protein Poli38472_004213 [Pythium oligandrum]
MGVHTGHGVSVAFALTFAAGLATVLGGMVVFSRRLVHLANPTSLAVALSISGGVMIFISFVEIFNESVHLLDEGIKSRSPTLSTNTARGHAWLAATGCFALGITLIYVVDAIVHRLAPEHEATEVDRLENLGETMDQFEKAHHVQPQGEKKMVYATDSRLPSKVDEDNRRALQRMGLLSALAIGLHNIPEGIATYVGSVRNTSVGFSLAVGIALHNIPEGIAVAAPIYFATGSRWRGIMWCIVSALAEPLGGMLAWLAIGDGMDPISEGILFGIVCGIMVCICLKELWPTSFRFAKEKTYLVAYGTFGGMFIMITSLILFAYAGV